MRTKTCWFTAALAVVMLLLPVATLVANDLATIHGQVRDHNGVPVAGALIVVEASSPIMPDRIAFSDRYGSFSIMNLFAGEYSLKVTMPEFLPITKQGIRLNPGGSAVLTVNLQNALDVVRRAIARDEMPSDDIVWTLRSSRSAQPILRLTEAADQTPESPVLLDQTTDYSGYFQVYSKSVETASGTSDSVGSQFSVTMPLDPHSKVTFAGQYTEAPTQPRGFGATYEFTPGSRHKAMIGLNMRQGSAFPDSLEPESLRELQLKYGEDFQWSDHLVLNYGAEIGRTDSTTQSSYLRPRFGISWVPQARTAIGVSVSSQAPSAADDPIRGKDYFDRVPYSSSAVERYSHAEAILSHFFSDNLELSAALFRDETDAQSMYVITPDGGRGLFILDTRSAPSRGFRIHVNRKFRNFEAGVGFTSASGFGLTRPASSVDDIQAQLGRRQFQVLSARFKADVDLTRTEITAIYRWSPDVSVSRIDSYQRLMEYNDPTLSLSIAQNLPAFRLFPAKLQAILDARNLFEQSSGPQHVQLVQYPRCLKGGINIKF